MRCCRSTQFSFHVSFINGRQCHTKRDISLCEFWPSGICARKQESQQEDLLPISYPSALHLTGSSKFLVKSTKTSPSCSIIRQNSPQACHSRLLDCEATMETAQQNSNCFPRKGKIQCHTLLWFSASKELTNTTFKYNCLVQNA